MINLSKDPINTSTARTDAVITPGFAGAMLIVVSLRICIMGIGLFSVYSAPEGAQPRFNYEHPWLAWDARNVYEVALHGYSPDRQGKPYREWSTFSLIAYFPLVPLVSRAMSSIMPLDVALVALSNVCSIIGFGFLYDWARRLAGARVAIACLLITATFPGAVSFAAGMTEGPFFMLVAMAFWLLQKERFYWAAIVVGIATATRPTGVALAAVVPLYAWAHNGSLPLPRRLTTLVALGVISFSGIMSYEAFLWQRYNSPTAYFEAQNTWHRLDQDRLQREAAHGVDRHSWEFFRERLTRPQTWNRAMALLVLVVSLVGLFKPTGIPRVFFLLPLLIFLITAVPDKGLRVSSLPRYESGATPLFLLAAIWLSARRWNPLLAGLLLLQFAVQAYYAVLFTREIWVG